MKSPLVSVIIPTFKRAEKIERAIKSAISQTYGNIEVVVVDDNAENISDRKANREILAKYPKVILVENEVNLGGGLSRNEGVKVAKGELLAFLDDDDEFMPDKIEQQVSLYHSASRSRVVGVVYCHAQVVRVDSTVYKWERMDHGYPLEEHIRSCVAPTSALLIPTNIFNEVGGFEDISSRQDASLIMKIIMSGYSVEVVATPLYKYYWHDGVNGISKWTAKSLEAEFQYRDIFKIYATNKKIGSKQKNTILNIFSFRLISVMLRLNMVNAAIKEAINGVIRKPFSLMNIENIARILLKPIYIKVSARRERAVRAGELK